MHDAYHYQECFKDRTGCLAPALNDPALTDWADAPLRHALRERCFEVPLPIVVATHANAPGVDSCVTLPMLARWLWFTTGLLRRKIEIDWNQPAAVLAHAEPLYARGTPSGGGLYPVEIYLVAKGVRGLDEGVYQYAEGRASLWRLRSGDFSRRLGRLLGRSVGEAGLHVVLAGRFWKSAFKYRAFAYQAMTEDAGAMLATLLRLASDDGVRTEVTYEFPDRGVDALLGLDEDQEVALLVVSVGRGAWARGPSRAAGLADERLGPVATYVERSRAVRVPAVIHEVHESTRRPAPQAASGAAPRAARVDGVAPGAGLRLPPGRHPPPLTFASLAARRSAMGPLSSRTPLTLDELGTLTTAMLAPYTSDAGGTEQPPSSIRPFLLARSVEGLDAGIHAVDARTSALTRHSNLPVPVRLQRLYFLENYNIDCAALVLFIVGRQREARARWGQRSLRICNAEAGLLAQRAYMACAQLGLACGAFLGFDTPLADGLLGLDRTEESTLLCMLVARPPESIARFLFNLD
jgi:SagB-type dehydrogenase family enzyme